MDTADARLAKRMTLTALLTVSALLPVPGALDAQDEGASLLGTVWDSTSAAALQGAAVYIVGTGRVTETDTLGRFAFAELAGGNYSISVRHPHFDSLGIEVPPQWRVVVADTGTTRTTLAVPPLSTILPTLCPPEVTEGAVVGTVRDAATGTPLPRATVEVIRGEDRWHFRTDEFGRFVACGLPVGETLVARASYYERASRTEVLEARPDQPVYRDFMLRVQPGAPVSGRVTDLSTSQPVSGAVVTVESADGERQQALTTEDGRFHLRDRLGLGTYIVEVQHVAHGTQARWFTLEDTRPVDLDLRVRAEALALEGLTVTVRSTGADDLFRSGVRVDVVDRMEIEELSGSARDVGDLVRTLPGLRVRNDIDPRTMQPRLCIEARRTAAPGCQSVLVVVDGIVSHPEILQAIPPDMIRNIEFVPALVAGARYGSRGGNGVLEITTMGGS